MTKQPTVWVTSTDPAKNFDDASRFGRVRILDMSDKNHAAAGAILQEEFEADDYIIFVGHPVRIAVCGQAVFNLFPQINVLIWDRKRMAYFSQLQEGI